MMWGSSAFEYAGLGKVPVGTLPETLIQFFFRFIFVRL